jgi:hypothetical protein
LVPTHGRGIGPANLPINQWRKDEGDQIGCNWKMPAAQRRAIRHVIYDTNFWKSFVHSRLATVRGDKGCLDLFGESREHRLFSDHLTAEHRVRTEGLGRIVDVWKLPAAKPDNHWLDCVAGCAMLASVCGVELGRSGPLVPKKRLSLSEMRAAALAGRQK